MANTNNVNVTNRGFEYIVNYLNAGSQANWPQPQYIGWGGANGSNATTVLLPGTAPSATQGTGQWSDIGPFQEYAEARVTGTPSVFNTTPTNGTVGYQVVGTITSLSGQSVGESFLVMSSTKPNAYTITTSGVAAAATSMTVNTTGAATGYYQMNNEVIKVGTVASAVWTITRAQNASSAATASTGNCVTFGNVPGAGTSNPSNGDMFAHAGFQALALNTNDSIQFTWQINVTS